MLNSDSCTAMICSPAGVGVDVRAEVDLHVDHVVAVQPEVLGVAVVRVGPGAPAAVSASAKGSCVPPKVDIAVPALGSKSTLPLKPPETLRSPCRWCRSASPRSASPRPAPLPWAPAPKKAKDEKRAESVAEVKLDAKAVAGGGNTTGAAK